MEVELLAITTALAAATGIIVVLQQAEERSRRRRRRYWVHPDISDREGGGQFWTLYNEIRADEKKFLAYARMSMESFDELLSLLSTRLKRMDTFFRNSITPVERLIITLRYLATGQSLVKLHSSFMIGRSTASYIIRDTSAAIWEVLNDVVMKKPTKEEWSKIAQDFQKFNFPNCVGAIEGKRIPIVKPIGSAKKSLNDKKDFSFVLFAVADPNFCFTHVDIGSYGSSSDTSIFGQSSFGRMLREDTLDLPDNSPLPGAIGPALPNVFVGDEAFSLGEHLLTPYSNQELNVEQKVFNFRLRRARRVVEYAFAIMSNKWRFLHKPIYLNMQNAITVVKAACVLHNFVLCRDGYLFEDSLSHCMERAISNEGQETTHGAEIRDNFASYFMTPTGQVAWQLDAVN